MPLSWGQSHLGGRFRVETCLYEEAAVRRSFGSKYNKVHLFREYRASALLYEFPLPFSRAVLDRIQTRYHRLGKAVSRRLKDVSYPHIVNDDITRTSLSSVAEK